METNSMYDTYTAAGGYCHKCGTYIGGASHIWYVNGNQPVCEVCLNNRICYFGERNTQCGRVAFENSFG